MVSNIMKYEDLPPYYHCMQLKLFPLSLFTKGRHNMIGVPYLKALVFLKKNTNPSYSIKYDNIEYDTIDILLSY